MNILFATDTYLPLVNGIVISIETFRKSLLESGHNLYIVAPKYPNYKSNENVIPICSIPFYGEKEHRFSFPFNVLRKARWSKLNLDIIHSHTIFNIGIFGYYLSKRLNIPLVHTYHTYYEKYVHYSWIPQFLSKPIARTYSRYYLNKCDLVIAPSQKIVDVLKDYGVKKKIIQLPTGIGNIKNYSDEEIKFFKRKFQRTPQTKILLYVGRIAQEKNLPLIIKSVINLINEQMDVVLLLVGDGPQKKHLQKFVHNEGKSEYVYFTGYIPHNEIGLYYEISDIFVFSSITDTQGLVILEALSFGLPIVAVKSGPICEILKDGENGLLSENSEVDFIQKIKYLIHNETLLNRLKTSKNEKLKELSISNQCMKLLEYYKQTIDGRKK